MPLIMDGDGALDGPSLKRRKLSQAKPSSAQPLQHHSRIFTPYRTIGLVSPTAVPFTSQALGKTTFQITTSIGRSLQTFDLRRGLNLVFVTRPDTPGNITATTAWKSKVFAAWATDESCGVWVYGRGKKEAHLEFPPQISTPVRAFCTFGSWIVGLCETQLIVWKAASLEIYAVLEGASPVPFAPCIVKPAALLNKVLVGRQDGSVELWNVSSGRLVYTVLPPSTSYGAVTAIEPTPALGLVAVAYRNGMLLIHDIHSDRVVMQLGQTSAASTTSISFRSDGLGAGEDGNKSGIMATSSADSGDISLWDLNEGGRKVGVLRAAHTHPGSAISGGTSKIEFLPGQAILVSSGLDNSLKTWIFDQIPLSPVPRPLHSRSGHGAPVEDIMFLPTASDGSEDTGKWLMTAGADRSLWGWSLRRDGQSTELSQGAIQNKAKKQGLLAKDRPLGISDLKCPPIFAMTCALNRDGGVGAIPGKHSIWQNAKGKQNAESSAMTGWESVVTAHHNDKNARTWFWGRKRAGRWMFPTGDGGNVSSVGISSCGTFALVASNTGSIDMFNLQSGLHRQSFPAKLTPVQAKQWKAKAHAYGLLEEQEGARTYYRGQGKHRSPVVGVAIDSLNRTVISAEREGKIKFWDFASGLLRHQMDWSASTTLTGMRYHQDSDLLGLACSDGCIRMVDSGTFKLIRELWPAHPALRELDEISITAFSISSDGRWVAAGMGALIILWDLPTAHVIDAFALSAECSSLAFSPTGEYLAVSSRSSVGVDILTNRSVFSNVSTHRIGRAELAAIIQAGPLNKSSANETPDLIATGPEEVNTKEVEDGAVDMEDDLLCLSSSLLSLSLVPRARWQNLLHLDTIRQRNKPIEPPKKPEKAPFFLPSLGDPKTKQLKQVEAPSESPDTSLGRSRFLNHGLDSSRSTFSALLQKAARMEDYNPVVEYFQTLSPAAADLEIRSLSPTDNETLTFVKTLISMIEQRKAYELSQTWMAVFLRVHSDAIVRQGMLRSAVSRWRALLDEEKQRVQQSSGYVNGMVAWLRAARV